MYTNANLVSCYVPGLPSTRGEDLQMKCLLELYGLKVNAMSIGTNDFPGIAFFCFTCLHFPLHGFLICDSFSFLPTI